MHIVNQIPNHNPRGQTYASFQTAISGTLALHILAVFHFHLNFEFYNLS